MKRRGAISLAFLLVALFSVGVAHGEITQSEGLQINFGGGFSPRALPRQQPAPVTVRISGSIGTVNGTRPPELRRVSFAINRHGKLLSRGLPVCAIGSLESTTGEAALARCRSALIGRGSFGGYVEFPGRAPFPARGSLLVFNGRSAGQPEMLFHLYVADPVQVTLVLPFKVVKRSVGTFGTVLSATIPKIAGELGYVTNIELEIGRRYRYEGKWRSLLSASCAAPPGFPGAIFDFAKGSFDFANGQQLSTTLTRDCRVIG
jgi:hypothetical protein